MKNCYFNFKIFLLKFETWYLNLKIVISIVQNIIWIWKFWFEYDIFNSKRLIWSKNLFWILN
jgi:hypothetical protein